MFESSSIILILSFVASLSNGASTVRDAEIIDLSWPLENQTLHWPSIPGFKSELYHDGVAFSKEKNGTYYYKSDGFSMGTHVGTHLDAPAHFSNTSWTVDKIALQRMVNVPYVIFDLSKKVSEDRTYCFQVSDFVRNPPESFDSKVVLVYTGMSSKYSAGKEEYFGTNTTDYLKMKIPGFSKEAAVYLADLGTYGVGLDAPSADCSRRHDSSATINPEAHNVFNSKNMFILENLNDQVKVLLGVKAGDPRLTIIPLRMNAFSGSPVRPIITMSDKREVCPECLKNSASNFKLSKYYFPATLLLVTSIFHRMLNASA